MPYEQRLMTSPAQLFNQAFSLHQSGRLADAARLYLAILDRQPTNAKASHMLGVIALQQGDTATAIRRISIAVAVEDRNPDAHFNLGEALRMAGRLPEAAVNLRRAVSLRPKFGDAHHSLAMALDASGRTADALPHYRQAVDLDPKNATAFNNLGVASQRLGYPDQALAAFQRAVALLPDYADAHINLASTLKLVGRVDEALAGLQNAALRWPNKPNVHYNFGVALEALDRLDEAAVSYLRAIDLAPGHANAINNLGLVREHQGRLKEALTIYDRAIALAPTMAPAHYNRANDLRKLGRYGEAVDAFSRAIELAPNYREAYFNRALARLTLGDFQRGWVDYFHRDPSRTPDRFPKERLPADLHGQTVLLRREQGIGDEVFFLRFAPLLAARGARVIAQCDPRLIDMVRRMPGIADAVPASDPAPPFDQMLWLADLPFLLGIDTPADLPAPTSIAVLPARRARMKERLTALGGPPYVGVTWRAGTIEHGRFDKSVPAAELAAAVKSVPATIVMLQRNPEPGERAAFDSGLGRSAGDLTGVNDDVEDMLALVCLIDDYVTVSNANVHFRAAVGRPCRLLLPTPPEFRWMADGPQSPWFPGFPLYRQGADGDWSAALSAVAGDLRRAFAGHP